MTTLTDGAGRALLLSPESDGPVRLRKADIEGWRMGVGRAIQRAMRLRGWTLKEFAAAVDRDPRQCARWMDGSERPQLDTLFAVETLRPALVQALSELAGADVQTVITMRRVA